MDVNNLSRLPIVLSKLAGQASAQNMSIHGLNFPDYWQIVKPFTGNIGQGKIPVQGFLATGNSDPENPTSPIIAALAIGINWADFLANYHFSNYFPYQIPKKISGSDGMYNMEYFFLSAYESIRKNIWNALGQFLGDYNLYICGMGLGSPLAQLAAIDLRPGNQGPENAQFGPSPQAPCYVYSAPNITNKAFATYYKSKVVDTNNKLISYNYQAKKPGLIVDFFPTAPNTDEHSPLGEIKDITNVVLPTIDVPWYNRGNLFYTTELGGSMIAGPKLLANLHNLPAGYEGTTAYAMAQLSAQAYHLAQHSSSTSSFGNYKLKTSIKVEGNDMPFAFLFYSGNNFVVAFRGSITFNEFYTITANSLQTSSGSVLRNYQVHTGVSNLYNTKYCDITGTFREALRATIKKYVSSTDNLFLTGHDIGGALANLAAIDYAINPSFDVNVKAVYTFGTMALGGIEFQKEFNEQLGTKAYNVKRIYDSISNAFLSSGYAILGNPVLLDGQLEKEENTYHALSGYLALLDPQASVTPCQLQ